MNRVMQAKKWQAIIVLMGLMAPSALIRSLAPNDENVPGGKIAVAVTRKLKRGQIMPRMLCVRRGVIMVNVANPEQSTISIRLKNGLCLQPVVWQRIPGLVILDDQGRALNYAEFIGQYRDGYHREAYNYQPSSPIVTAQSYHVVPGYVVRYHGQGDPMIKWGYQQKITPWKVHRDQQGLASPHARVILVQEGQRVFNLEEFLAQRNHGYDRTVGRREAVRYPGLMTGTNIVPIINHKKLISWGMLTAGIAVVGVVRALERYMGR